MVIHRHTLKDDLSVYGYDHFGNVEWTELLATVGDIVNLWIYWKRSDINLSSSVRILSHVFQYNLPSFSQSINDLMIYKIWCT